MERVVVTLDAAPIPKSPAKINARISTCATPNRNAAAAVINRLPARIGFLPILSLYEPKNVTVINSAMG